MKIRIGGVQLGPNDISVHKNVDKVIDFIKKAEKLKVDILSFPELCTTTYFPKHTYDEINVFLLSEHNSLYQRVIKSTLGFKVTIIFPYAEKTDEGIYNTADIIQNGKVIGKYRKIHIPILKENSTFNNLEERYFKPGNLGFPVFKINGIKIGIQICFDRHFPEGFRILGLKGTQVVFVPTNSAAFGADPRRIEMWDRLMQVRAYENGYYIVAINKAGTEEGWDFMGNSLIVDSTGEIIKRLDQFEETIFYEDITFDVKNIPCKFYEKRRPDQYNYLLSKKF